MSKKIVVAGATGNLGGRIVHALQKQGAEVHALVRPKTEVAKTHKLQVVGARIAEVDMTDGEALARACEGASCVVSALQGLRDVVIDAQAVLVGAAVKAGVPRFIPSDYSIDFTKLPEGENRNLDLRREFYQYLDGVPIQATSILNGAFMDMLLGQMPLLDFKSKRVSYWESPDVKLDFTTMDDTAAFTAAAALDQSTPRKLNIAGEQISARELANTASEITQTDFELVRLGSLDDLATLIQQERSRDTEGEKNLYPRWQGMQYMHGMFSGLTVHDSLDNERYPLKWTSVRELLSTR